MTAAVMASELPLGERTLRRVRWRLLPFLGLLYIVSYLDRVNVSFAKLTMNAAIGIDDATYAFGAGIFFIGYFLFEVPSNLILERVGARRWIARIMITWGLVSAATAFIAGATSFVAMRFLLGVAEAGFFPGILLYLTYWFPSRERARVVGLFMTALPLSGLIGSPLGVRSKAGRPARRSSTFTANQASSPFIPGMRSRATRRNAHPNKITAHSAASVCR